MHINIHININININNNIYISMFISISISMPIYLPIHRFLAVAKDWSGDFQSHDPSIGSALGGESAPFFVTSAPTRHNGSLPSNLLG